MKEISAVERTIEPIVETPNETEMFETETSFEIDLPGIKQKARELFKTLVPTPDKEEYYFAFYNSLTTNPELELILAKLAHTKPPRESDDGLITPELSQATLVFLEELILIIEDYSKTAAPKDISKTFAALHNSLFSSTPSLINNLKLEQLFSLCAKMERAPQALAAFGSKVYPELEYELFNYSVEQSVTIAKQIGKTPVSEQLNYLGVCYKILAAAIFGGSKTSEHTLQSIEIILTSISTQSAFPLARYTAESLLQIIVHESEKDSGAVTFGRTMHQSDTVNGQEFLTDQTLLPFSSPAEQADILFLFQKLNQPLLRNFLENKFNLKFDEIPVREQLHFLQYLAEKDTEILERLATVLNNKPNLDKTNFLKSFFACSTDKKNGDILLEFTESASVDTVNAILLHYAGLVNVLAEIEDQMADFFISKGTTADPKAVIQEMSHRSSRTLLNNIEHGKTLNQAELETELANIEADIALFASIFRIARKENPALTFAEIRGFGVERVRGNQLNNQQKLDLEKIFAKNYAGEPEFITRFHNFLNPQDETGQILLAKNEFTLITQTVTSKKSTKPTVIAFYRLEEQGENEIYFAANNVDSQWQSSGLGRAALEATLKEVSQDKVITATFPPDTDIGPFYISKLGFVGTGTKKEMGKYSRFTMRLDPKDKSLQFPGQSMVDLAQLVQPPGTNAEKIIRQDLPFTVLQFTLPAESDQAYATAEILCANGYVLSQYLIADKKTNQRWYGFEKINAVKNPT